MKKLNIIIFCLISLTIFSQSSVYKPFCKNPSWTISIMDFGGTQCYSMQYQLDTIIGPYAYKKIINLSQPQYYALFREDSTLKRVYQYDKVNFTEYLYIDFNLVVGNIFPIHIGNSIYTSTVVTKDSILINGVYHNNLVFSDPTSAQPYQGYNFTEGVLSFINPLSPNLFYGDPVVRLASECHNGQFYFKNDSSNCNLSCNGLSASIQQISLYQVAYEIHPNPSTSIIKIETATNIEDKSYLILDYTNKEILRGRFNSKNEIDVLNLPSGIYFLNIGTHYIKFIKD